MKGTVKQVFPASQRVSPDVVVNAWPDVYAPDHCGLLARVDHVAADLARKRPSLVDAIVVPAARVPDGLQWLADLANESARILILLCSQQCRPAEVEQVLGRSPALGIPVLIVDLEAFRWRGLGRGLQLNQQLRWDKDTALKRNVGLLIARRLGLAHVLFLDDDVYGLSPSEIGRAVDLLENGDYLAAAWSFDNFPDNSAVSHAYRQYSGEPLGRQGCFVGGGGLMVRLDGRVPHFPLGIYNEDWFFVFDLLSRGRVALMGGLKQDPYPPFANPEKAAAQEFGDMIAERVMKALSEDRRPESRGLLATFNSGDFWAAEIDSRRIFLRLLRETVEAEHARLKAARARKGVTNSARDACAVVTAALHANSQLKKHHVRAWIAALHADCTWWRDEWPQVHALRQGAEAWSQARLEPVIDDAISALGLGTRTTKVWPAAKRRISAFTLQGRLFVRGRPIRKVPASPGILVSS